MSNFDQEIQKCFNFQHGLSMLGINSNVPIPAYIDTNGLPQVASSAFEQMESFGLIYIIDEDQLCYLVDDGIIQSDNHGYPVGSILYLQDDGSLGTTPGTFVQKIYEAIDENCLQFLKQAMYCPTNTVSGVARIQLPNQTISNTLVNQLQYGIVDFDSIGLTVGANTIQFPTTAIYDITLLINFFDNNSVRVAHKSTLKLDGNIFQNSIVWGENYIRDGSLHDNSSLRHLELGSINSGQILTFDIESHSSLLNTTDIIGGWLILKQL